MRPDEFSSCLRLRTTFILVVAASLSLPALIGCGNGRRAAVEGSVTLDGRPLDEGRITFFPVEGNSGPTAGAVILNGRYKVSASMGVWTGRNRVEIHGNRRLGGDKQVTSVYPRSQSKDGKDELVDAVEEAVPPIYNERSQLVHDIPSGKSVLDFELRSR